MTFAAPAPNLGVRAKPVNENRTMILSLLNDHIATVPAGTARAADVRIPDVAMTGVVIVAPMNRVR